MLQVIPAFCRGAFQNLTFTPFAGKVSDSVSQGAAAAPATADGVITALRFQVSAAPGAGNGWTLRIQKNGSTVISCAITGSATEASASDAIPVTVGDLLSYRLEKTGTPPAMHWYSAFEFEHDDPDVAMYGFQFRAGWNATEYSAPCYGSAFNTTQARQGETVMPASTVTALAIHLTAAAGAHSITYTLVKNGIDQNGSGGTPNTVVTFTGATVNASSTFSLSLSYGDLLSVKCVTVGTPGSDAAGMIRLEGATQLFARASLSTGITTTPRYMWPVGTGPDGTESWTTPIADRPSIFGPSATETTGMIVHLVAAPGVGQSVTFTLQKNQTDTTTTVTLSDTATDGGITDTVAFAPGDTFNLTATKTGGTANISAAITLVAGTSAPPKLAVLQCGAYSTVRATLSAFLNFTGLSKILDTDYTIWLAARRILIDGDEVLINGVDFAGGGFVDGPGSSTDNAAVRFDGTSGTTIQAAPPIFEDDGRISNVTDPSGAQDAATKAYVDGIAVNLGKRSTVRAATTATITISTALNNGDTLDGVTLATGDRVLVKNQAAPAENGVYVVGVSPARATDYDTYDEHPGSLIAVQEGTANADTLWLCTSNPGGILNTTAIAFTALNVSGGITQLTGDVTAGPGSGSQAATIANDAVTYAKIQNISAASRLLGRGSAGGSGDAEELTLGSGLMLTGTTLSSTGSGGDVVGPSSSVDGEIALFDSTTGKLIKRATGTGFVRAASGVYSASKLKRTIGIIIGSGTAVISTGVAGFVSCPVAGTITKVRLLSSDPSVTSGSIVVDIWKDTYTNYPPAVADSITASAKPTITSTTKSEDATLTGWTTSVTAGDIFGFNVDSVTSLKRVTVEITVDE